MCMGEGSSEQFLCCLCDSLFLIFILILFCCYVVLFTALKPPNSSEKAGNNFKGRNGSVGILAGRMALRTQNICSNSANIFMVVAGSGNTG